MRVSLDAGIIYESTGYGYQEVEFSEKVSGAERAWLRLEVPDERRLPQFDSVKHKFCHFVTSGGMLFFILVCLLSIFVASFLPYLLKQPIPGIGV